ncbi:HlyD family efflux transporter periplasmic adaptor subunit [Aliiglaciecola sp. CAU 1673]|uniref:HlyD family secretion protein n=1 Tax=Aliiglaciecola sp. CAU 1673 TaxID=3032595 RepID=UPI0023DA2D5D|nr:HlyD family efflux transporter periplasmic adaptor subunit [Aliiglaciecola sp. CAU 1673]MDF2179063.1 HlyD family efflux transporter periplasmic adaptor subunit [Aliiglaciecola sp. CAU 1673]
MDIKREKPKKSVSKLGLLVGFGSFAIAGIWLLVQPGAEAKVDRQDIWTAQVQRGDLPMQVDGFGKLKSKVQRLLTAPTNALVEEIVLRPGALVTPDSIILRLSNPEVEQEVRDAKRELDNRKAEVRQLKINQQRELLTQKAILADLSSKLELAQVRVEAEAKLHAEGIVSSLDFKRSTTELEQFKQLLNIEQQRLEQLAQGHEESLVIAQERIDQQQEQLAVITQRFERLIVRAGMDGVLQQLPVELGQNVAIGEQVALVGSMKELQAQLLVSQSQVQQLAIGQSVDIDTRGGQAEGRIRRIDPVIQQGSVLVEVEITSALPDNARPELSIDGLIHTGQLTNTLYIKKPIGARPGNSMRLFRLSDESHAKATNINLGAEAGDFIQIIAGAAVGESYILTDMSRWQDQPSISIKD